MKVSFLIVSYNEIEYLRQAIESCLNQTVFKKYECEIIIGDDGSNDGSVELIDEYSNSNKHITYFVMNREGVTKENVIPSIRVSNLIKKCISMSSGDYFQVLSGDDFFPNESSTELLLSFLEKNQKYYSSYFDYYHYYNDNKIEKPTNLKCHKYSRSLLWSYEYRHVSCFLFKKEVSQYLLDRICDDTGLVLCGLKAGKTKYFNEFLFNYRQRESGITQTSSSLDLYLVELILMQDVLNKKYFKWASYSKFYAPLKIIINRRKELINPRYQKYIKESEKNKNNIIGLIINSQFSIKSRLKLSALSAKCFISKVIFKIYYLLSSII